METKWVLTMGIVFAVLFVGGMIICFAMTFYQCEKVDILESAKQSALFAAFPSLVPVLTNFVPRVLEPFVNVLRDTFGVSSEKAPTLGLGYLIMLVSWVSGARTVGAIQKAVCIPTIDEVAAFKAHFQKKAAKGDIDEQKREEESKKSTKT